MINRRSLLIVAAAALLVVAAVTFQMGTMATTAPRAVGVVNEVQPQPAGNIPLIASSELSDYYERHPGATIRVEVLAGDWFQRHPELGAAAGTDVFSDWYQRHPELIKTYAGQDLSDYYQRHWRENLSASPEAGAGQSFDPNAARFRLAVPADLSDWFERHRQEITR